MVLQTPSAAPPDKKSATRDRTSYIDWDRKGIRVHGEGTRKRLHCLNQGKMMAAHNADILCHKKGTKYTGKGGFCAIGQRGYFLAHYGTTWGVGMQ
jgi:hypothetical protein